MKKHSLPGKTILAILSITTLEIIALCTHTDGALLGMAFAAIAGLGGYELHRFQKK